MILIEYQDMEININYLKGVKGVDKVKENKKLVKKFWTFGYHLRREYIKRDKDKDVDKSKIRGISYRLLNSLKTRNSEI